MSRLNIKGQVFYSDMTPAAAADVTIVELDDAPGGRDDKILRKTTASDGRFAGRSGEWDDREGVVIVDLPDLMRLEFVVKVDGKTHSDHFILVGEDSVPIILPFGPAKPVPKSARELVQVILLSKDLEDGERPLYEFIEDSTASLTSSLLGNAYRKVTFLRDADATLDGFVGALGAAAAAPGAKAVDLIFTTHGLSGRMVLFDGKLPESTVRKALLKLPEASRNKFRAVFSTACFGSTHLDTWRAVGFTEASGAVGIYADSAVSYAPFLAAWAVERTFAQAVDAANAADVLDAADEVARAFYRAKDLPNRAAQVDSTRTRAGDGWSRIYSLP